MSSQHATLSAERWARFSFGEQVLMIGNEMNRGANLLAPFDRARLRSCYERILNLVDLTVQVQDRPARRRELLRWRDLIAGMLIADATDPEGHADAFRCLLRLTPVASAQIPFVLRAPAGPPAPERSRTRSR